MEDIRLYDFEFQPVLYLPDVISANWIFYYNDIGTFEAYLPITVDLLRVLNSHPYLVAVQGEKQAIITGRQIREQCVLYGRSCNWLLTRRVTPAFSEQTESATSIAHGMVEKAFADVSGWVCESFTEEEGQISFSLTDDENTFDAVQSCLNQKNLGHEVYFSIKDRQWVYRCVQGQVLPLVISDSHLNAYDTEYAESCLDYYSGGWYEKPIKETDAGSEMVRTYLGDETKTGIYRWDCVLASETEEEAKAKLIKKKWSRNVKSKTRNLQYGRDYKLGDKVLVEMVREGFCSSDRRRITGVHIWYEAEGSGEEPIFEEV